MQVGRHVGPGGQKTLAALEEIPQSQKAFQVFAGGRINRKVSHPPVADYPKIKELIKERQMYGMIHAAYVINLCQDPDADISVKSRQHLLEVLDWGQKTGILNVNFHPGSAKDLDLSIGEGHLVENCKLVLDEYEGPAKLILENSSGSKAGKKVGADLTTLDQLAKAIGDQERVAVCIDTTHAFAAGYPMEEIISECTKTDYLEAIHFNPPAPEVKCGSFLDRHGTMNDSCWNQEDIAGLAKGLEKWPLVMETKDAQDPETLLSLL
jgi:deoxyribonuclease IV